MVRLTQTNHRLLEPVLEAAFSRVKTKGQERWTVPFVFRRLEEGRAGLFRIHDDGDHMGWMVVERYDQGESWLNVWIMEGKGLERSEEVIPLIDNLARSVGCNAWRCTGRKGWKSIGLKPIATVYERVLT